MFISCLGGAGLAGDYAAAKAAGRGLPAPQGTGQGGWRSVSLIGPISSDRQGHHQMGPPAPRAGWALLGGAQAPQGASGSLGTLQGAEGWPVPDGRRSARSLQQPCSLPNTKWQPLPGFGAAPGSARAAGPGQQHPQGGLQHPLGPRTPKLADTCLGAEWLIPVWAQTPLGVLPRGCLHPRTAMGVRLSAARGQIGSMLPARREIRSRVGSCWYHLLN